jgi:PAS domain-containing protein
LTFRSAVLDSLTANIAVLDPNGEIVAVNGSWRDFAISNQMDNSDKGVGTNYLAVCRSARADDFYHEYPCHSPDRQRWFALRATPLVDYPRFVVVAHEDITERVLAEMVIRSSNKETKPD